MDPAPGRALSARSQPLGKTTRGRVSRAHAVLPGGPSPWAGGAALPAEIRGGPFLLHVYPSGLLAAVRALRASHVLITTGVGPVAFSSPEHERLR